MPASRRSLRRHRHLNKSASPSTHLPRPGHTPSGRQSKQQDFATAGTERASLPNPDPSKNPKNLSDFDPAYGNTHTEQSQPKGGQAPYERESYGNQSVEGEDSTTMEAGHGGGESGFGKTYGQGFGVGPGHGAESAGQGLEGSPRERDYRGNAGTTFGAVVGPDALKPDTKEDNQRRPDPKPDNP